MSKTQQSHVYSYTPLSTPRCFRVLEVSPGRIGEPLCCALIEHSLDDPPQYKALSYTWGDPTRTREVLIGDTKLGITENLYFALSSIRDADVSITLWADAICIDQSNIPERNAQVRCMRDIYEKVDEVVVSLGREADGSEGIPSLFERINRAYKAHLTDHENAHTYEFDTSKSDILPDKFKDLGLPHFKSPEWTTLTKFLYRPWLRRTWILQEVVMAKHTIVMCGDW